MVRVALAGHADERRLTYPVQDPTGERWFNAQVVGIPGQHSGALVVHLDITAEKAREQQWQHCALHDALTGLPNRALLSDRLEHAVARSARDADSLAVLFIDIDAFKAVNDRFGHHTGDELLRRAAEQMAGSVRSADTFGRWGGDEFLVIAERLDDAFSANDVADRLTASVDTPFDVGSERLTVSVSIGAAYLEAFQTPEQLIQKADHALRSGRAARPQRTAR
jgi:diguanylate cyclase (GGDEF)-like protein